MTHQDLVCAQELSDYCCALQGIRVRSCTVGRLAFSEEAQIAFVKFLSSGFYIFLAPLREVKEHVWSSVDCAATVPLFFMGSSAFPVSLLKGCLKSWSCRPRFIFILVVISHLIPKLGGNN